MISYDIIIPSRYDSARLPGKALLDVAGKALIQRVVEAAELSRAENIIVATDHQDIAQLVQGMGVEAVMTAPDHPSGTDRIAEVVDLMDLEDDRIIVNLQGDEPLVPAELPDQTANLLADNPWASIATLSTREGYQQIARDPDTVKVVSAQNGEALYFSRAAIPFDRDGKGATRYCFRHIGIYAYRAGYLRRHVTRPPCDLELTEKLEQLRALYYGEKIVVAEARAKPGPGVDNADDLKRAATHFILETNHDG